jgi:hypothetical protein
MAHDVVISDVYSRDDEPWTIRVDCPCIVEALPSPKGMMCETVLDVGLRLPVRFTADANGRVEVKSAESV